MRLPEEFATRMQSLLGEEYDAFLATYDEPRRYGLRVNTLKISPQELEAVVPFALERIPFCPVGYRYEKNYLPDPARHPFYYAGLYYLQEPSAMTPASVLSVEPGDYVLDLCAAPGGKATALAAKLQGKGLLVANEISASRAKALLKNIEVFGVKNSFVTNGVPARLAEQFGVYFDKILVDAPCSGEGMFRKDIANARAWSLEKVKSCARTQKDIIVQAASMLRPGGMLLYSTCTFAPEENEQVIAWLLDECPEMELCEIPWQEGFSHGRPELCCEDCTVHPELSRCVRIFPHKMEGEGHFLALLRKRADAQSPERAQRLGGTASGSAPTRAQWKILDEFLQDVTMEYRRDQIEVRKEQVYLIPERPKQIQGIPFLRNGLYLGEIRRDRFEPSQSFAMALRSSEYASILDFDWSDERVYRYLRGETIDVDDKTPARKKGWQLVCTNGYSLGWGKLANGTLKNKYHSGWRMQ
jgi:NOL1/NOP2/sun family putative RNA methylase